MTIVFIIILIYLTGIEPYLKKNASFKTKKLLDIFRYIMLYIVMISCFSENKIGLCLITAFCVLSSTIQLCLYVKVENKKETDDFKMTLMSCTVELFVSMALTYYTLYVINPNWFQVNDVLLDSVWQNYLNLFILHFNINNL